MLSQEHSHVYDTTELPDAEEQFLSFIARLDEYTKEVPAVRKIQEEVDEDGNYERALMQLKKIIARREKVPPRRRPAGPGQGLRSGNFGRHDRRRPGDGLPEFEGTASAEDGRLERRSAARET